ncbi:MAG TPA: acylneuraminate cytidylyltransferase [Rhodoglobus sp.]|nr:acylneuraminate cytidylyltransferase [Rhodoglobus sp.]
MTPLAADAAVVAVIPARGGSKGVPGKNLQRVGGVPLVVRAIRAAQAAASIDTVLVSTDDPRIAELATEAGATVVDRPTELSGDTASSEGALLHALDVVGGSPGVLVFLQATSPFIDPDDLDAAVTRVRAGECDVVFSAIASHGFLWGEGAAGAVGVNHDASYRPRRQDRDPEFLETGAFYVLRVDGFRRARHRFFGRVGVAIVDPRSAIEVDTRDDLELARAIAPLLNRAEPIDVDALVTDFDGVHTDDRVHVGVDGQELVTASRADGWGVEQLRTAGIPVLILSKERHPVVGARGAKLGVEVLQGIDEKADALQAWAHRRGIPLHRIAYVGNDLGDLPAMHLVGWPIAVADAQPLVTAAARVVLEHRGGHGAVREVADRILSARSAHHDKENPWSASARTR